MVDVRGLDPRFAPSSRLSGVRFLTYTGEEMQSISCKKITNPNTFDSLLHPNNGGLYDPSLGPCDKQDLCGTCRLNYVYCPGHMGHISLPLPVYHPIFFMSLYQLARGSCWNCHRLFASPFDIKIFTCQLELIKSGLISDALSLESRKLARGSGDPDDASKSTKKMIQELSDFVVACKARALESGVIKSKTKNVVKLKQVLISNFLKGCSKSGRKCFYCEAPVRSVRQEGRTRMFLKPLARRNAAAWVSSRKTELGREKRDLEQKKQSASGGGAEGSVNKHTEEKLQLVTALGAGLTTEQCTKQSFISPLEVREHICGMWEKQSELMKGLFGGKFDSSVSPMDIFFLDVVPVPPSRFRPIAQVGDKKFENPQTANLHRVLTECMAVYELMAERAVEGVEEAPQHKSKLSFSERLQAVWVRLQTNVNCFMDSSSDKKGTAPNGIKQILEKKEGLFRKHMMGKRVDYAARSVISPDPYINMDEIGVPMVFASRLTYPQPVTHWNVKELRQAVINGPHQHPGATHVQNEDGSVVLLHPSNKRQRTAIAKKLLTPSKDVALGGANKKVFRHLKNGDVLLVNRQPTLHKPSIMAHRARVLPGEKTLRLHYANCKSYNADFDGDEMNAHFPQNELARAEAYNIVSTREQYLVPKDGTPLSGLIQDHVVSGVLMTVRGRFFNRSDYMQLVFSALPRFHGYFKTLPPCVWRPEMLWSGKQVVSTVLLNIIPQNQDKLNLTSHTKIAAKEWGRGVREDKQRRNKQKTDQMEYHDDIMTESEVVFCEGELMCGVLDKSQFGASQFGFVHSCHELYGGSVSNLLLSALGRLFTTFLQHRGFTLGVEDLLVTDQANRKRHALIAEGRGSGPQAAAEAFGIAEADSEELFSQKYESFHRSQDQTGIKTLDYYVKKKTGHYNNSINSVCVPAGLQKPFPNNCLQLMVQAGAKGSTVNCMQISCLLGQIELEGQRPPLMTSGRFLPSFRPYDSSPRAGGFVDGRFLTGIRPQEYFFHCMAGREGLVDTAVKTSRSGYLQRCLIKHLEGICVGYDLSVRDSDGSVVQFLYGEDGMDINKTRFLRPQQFPFLIENYEALSYSLDPQSAVSRVDCRKVPKYQKKLDRWHIKHAPRRGLTKPYKTGFLNFSEKHLPELMTQYPSKKRSEKRQYRTKAHVKLLDSWFDMSPMARESVWNKYSDCPVPVNAHLRPDTHFGSVSEKLSEELESFIDQNHRNILGPTGCSPPDLSPEKFRSLVQFKCLRALADPGEAVGLLAAQSIGEPSTQMTLNTFHFAGRGEMNVTLGIPRLREILMTASPNIKTPAMDVPLLSTDHAKAKGEELKKRFTRVYLADVLEKVEVWETMSRQGMGHLSRSYKVKLNFLPPKYYQEEFVVSPHSILEFVETTFLKKFVSSINKEIKLVKEKRLKAVSVEKETSGLLADKEEGETEEAAPPDEDEDEDSLSEMENGEGDATDAKQRFKKQQQASYEDAGDSDMEGMDVGNEGYSSDEEEGTTTKNVANRENDEDSDVDDYFTSVKAAMDKGRLQKVLEGNRFLVDYVYDSVDEQWCQFTFRFPLLDSKVMLTSIMGKLASKVVVWETPMINKGYLSESAEPGETGLWRLKTDGVNLQVLWSHPDVFDLTRAYTNNIHAMANTYGIEAACKSIIKEISGVFKVYGITVDPRHLSLIADYMTFEGSYKPFNRIGIEGNSSPFQKMSFETTMHFLKNATITGESDPIKSPSACLVTGRVVQGGTGSFELLQSLV